jgi:hypothetical protein
MSLFSLSCQPSVDILEELLRYPSLLEATGLVAKCYILLGMMLKLQNKYAGSKEIFKQALQESICIGDMMGAAQCLRRLGNILTQWLST